MIQQKQKEHELIKIKIADVKLDKTNPNVMTREQMAGLRESMNRWGYLTPIIVDQNNMIADGEHRLLVYKELGYKEIPAYRLKLQDDIERKMIRQVMNKLKGEHSNRQLDADELATIFENHRLDDLSKLIATQKEDLQRLILRYHPALDFVTPENEQEEIDKLIDEELKKNIPDTQLGDIYQLGNHRLICADCTDKRSIDKLMEGKKVDLVLTDPPYGVDYGAKNEYLNSIAFANRIETPIINDGIKNYREFFNNFLSRIPFNNYNICYIFMLGQELHNLRLALDDQQMKWGDYLIWIKNNHVLGRKDYNAQHEFIVYCWKNAHRFYGEFSTTILNYDKPRASDLHPIMKPLPLLMKLISDGSQEGMNVYDAFAGSGSILIACEQTNRHCFACEIDPHYVDICVERWTKYTGKEAIRLTDGK